MITRRRERERKIRRVKRCQRKYRLKGHMRLVVHRTARHIYAQIVDDYRGICVTGASSLTPEVRSKIDGLKKSEVAAIVGEVVASRARAKGIERVVFDRHGYKYHGRVRALAEGARKGGLIF